MDIDVENTQYNKIYDLIRVRTGLSLDDLRRKSVTRLINWRVTYTNSNLIAYENILSETAITDPRWQELIQCITIGETYFVRNKGHFEALRLEVLPALIQKRRDDGLKQLRIWSAGCSTGEESYSIAILLRELIPDIKTWSIFILGTDINEESLEQAKEGSYSKNAFRSETPDGIQKDWFEQNDKTYQIDHSIRDMVRFAPLNLISDDYPSFYNYTVNMDLILCRNVTIYFSQPETKEVLKRFWKALVPEGWLVVGHSEPNMDSYRDFTPRNIANTVMYQKTEKATQTDTSRTPTKAKTATLTSKSGKEQALQTLKPIKRPKIQKTAKQEHKDTEQANPLQLAKQAADQGQWDAALDWITRVEKNSELQSQADYLHALIQMEFNELDTAITSLRRAIYGDADFTLAYCTLGDVYAMRSNDDEALRWWKRAQSALKRQEPQHSLSSDNYVKHETLKKMIESRIGSNRKNVNRR